MRPCPAATTCLPPGPSRTIGVPYETRDFRGFSHFRDPVAASRAMILGSFPTSRTRTTSPSATIGDDSPGGAGTFHLTFWSGPNSTGGFWSSATPDPLGPRNCGQASDLSAASPTAAAMATATDASIPFISLTLDGCGPVADCH